LSFCRLGFYQRSLRNIAFLEGSATHRSLVEINDSASGCRIVEDRTSAAGLLGWIFEIARPLFRVPNTLQEKVVDRHQASGNLCRMQIPTLVEAIVERVVNIVEVKLPGSIDLGWEGQQVRRSVHQPYPSLCKRRQHHRPGKVTRGMM